MFTYCFVLSLCSLCVLCVGRRSLHLLEFTLILRHFTLIHESWLLYFCPGYCICDCCAFCIICVCRLSVNCYNIAIYCDIGAKWILINSDIRQYGVWVLKLLLAFSITFYSSEIVMIVSCYSLTCNGMI